jgi:translation initiation factor 4G
MLLGPDTENPPAEENIEALCQLFTTVGKQLEESSKPTNTIEPYFSQLKTYSTSPRFVSRIRFLMQNTIDLRANKWVPRREVVSEFELRLFFYHLIIKLHIGKSEI